jgi:hypothetical protein
MRHTDDIKADLRMFSNEVNAILDQSGVGGDPLAFYAVLDAHPDLNERWQKLKHEALKVKELKSEKEL